ncbi:MAG: transcriptional regulator [Gammaproteobacteria bacterium]|nr:transcriptional regulator [Gammaproteobacteria bacterium]
MNNLLSLIQDQGIVRRRDMDKAEQAALRRLYEKGRVIRIGKGLYARPDFEIDEHFSLVKAVKTIPDATVCLLSALHFHSLTTQLPFEIWLAAASGSHKHKPAGMPVRIIGVSGNALKAGRKIYKLHGVSVPVYNPAKTVADCFKHRNKIGLDIALEALKASWDERRCTLRELREYSEICGVRTVMQPYLEFLAA